MLFRIPLVVILLVTSASQISAQSDDMIAQCDMFARMGRYIYEQKMDGVSYSDALTGLTTLDEKIDKMLPNDPAKAKSLKETVYYIMKKAYTSSYPSAEAFSDHSREVCLR